MADQVTTEEAVEQRRNRLPTLMEVLNRRTLAPVDLFSFYIYMRDQQRSVDYLDFWLDVSQHLSLCRHYVRELHRSVLVETPDAEKALRSSKRSSELNLDSFDLGDEAGPSRRGPPSLDSEESQDQRVSRHLRYEDVYGEAGERKSQKHHSGSLSSMNEYLHQQQHQNQDQNQRSSYLSTTPPTPGTAESTTPTHTVSRSDIRSSAEKILYTFLLPGSEREIILPAPILLSITSAIEDHGRDDPEVFDTAKDYVFQAMERDAFPGFLRAKALGNLVPLGLMVRLVVGLLALFAGFWAAFSFIFLDYGRATRCWLILPFAVGVYLLASHQYMLDPVLAALGYSEYTLFNFAKVREPYVRGLLAKRGVFVGCVILGVAAALICIFVFVPGKRL